MGWLQRLGRSRASVDEARWVVLDVEASGLDASRDSLLAIAAVALHVDWPRKRIAIAPGDSFEIVLRQDRTSSVDNILLHGIGAQRQREGVDAKSALSSFRKYAGASPLLAFHAAFDRTLIERCARDTWGEAWPARWLDIEHLCAVTHESVVARSLDDWMAYFGIRCARRHQAAADAWAESEVLLRIWPRVVAQCSAWRDVEKLASHERWIARRS